MNFAVYLRQNFYRTLSSNCFCSMEKYFINKIEKNSQRKKNEKARKEKACEKNNNTQNT